MDCFDFIRTFDSLNHKAIAEALARINPELFANLANKSDAAGVPQWALSVADAIKADTIVGAVKLMREANPGLGLKEAVDAMKLARDGNAINCGGKPSETAESLAVIVRKALASTGYTPPPAPKPEPDAKPALLKVWLVRYEMDNTIHSVFREQSHAQHVADSMNANDPCPDVYVSSHFVD